MVNIRSKSRKASVAIKIDDRLILVILIAFLTLSGLSTLAALRMTASEEKAAAATAETAARRRTGPFDPDKPLLVVHVGPPKTGTTSLQHALTQLSSQLEQDGYHYLSNVTSEANSAICLRRLTKDQASASCWFDFDKTVQSYRTRGLNVLLSDENFGFKSTTNVEYYNHLQRVLDPWLPNVLIVVGYRHLHNFFTSTHAELQKSQRWPSERERGKHVTPLVQFWDDNREHIRTQLGPVATPAAVIQQWSLAYSPHVSALDIEQSEQVQEFVCNILPRANHTCTHHVLHPPTKMLDLNQHSSGQVNYDSLAILAWEQGYLKKEQTRKYVRAKIQRFNEGIQNRTTNAFPLNCLKSSDLDVLRDESIQHARDAGIDVDAKMTHAMTQNLEVGVMKQKYCSVDASKVLQEQLWIDFFSEAKTVW